MSDRQSPGARRYLTAMTVRIRRGTRPQQTAACVGATAALQQVGSESGAYEEERGGKGAEARCASERSSAMERAGSMHSVRMRRGTRPQQTAACVGATAALQQVGSESEGCEEESRAVQSVTPPKGSTR